MALRFDIISIGTLSRNRFWNEDQSARSAHATTTLIRDGGHTILVDPSLPGEILVHRLAERTGLRPEAVDAVFLTTFRPVHRRGLEPFAQADRLMGGAEIEAMTAELNLRLEGTERADQPPDPLVEEELAILGGFAAAPDKLTPRVHLFPSPGPTPGSACLLLVPATQTIAVAGDAVLTRDHFDSARVFEHASNVEQARESLAELVEIADQIVPGHDNLIVCRTGRP